VLQSGYTATEGPDGVEPQAGRLGSGPKRRVLVAGWVHRGQQLDPRDADPRVGVASLPGDIPAQAHLERAARRPASLPRQVACEVPVPELLGRLHGLVSRLSDIFAVLVPAHEAALEQIAPAGLPAQLGQPSAVPRVWWHRHETVARPGELVQNSVLLPNDLAEQREVEAIAHQRPADLPIDFPPACQLAPDLAGNQVGAVDPVGLEPRTEPAFQFVPTPQGHHFNHPALEIPPLGAGAEAPDLERLDPAGTGHEEGSTAAGVIDQGAVQHIRVRLVRRAAPDLIGPRARGQGDQLTGVDRRWEQRDLAHGEPSAQLGRQSRRDHQTGGWKWETGQSGSRGERVREDFESPISKYGESMRTAIRYRHPGRTKGRDRPRPLATYPTLPTLGVLPQFRRRLNSRCNAKYSCQVCPTDLRTLPLPPEPHPTVVDMSGALGPPNV